MALSNYQVFQEELYTARLEAEKDMIDGFNSQTNAITFLNMAHRGDFKTETFWRRIPNLVKERRQRADQADQTEVTATQAVQNAVKYGMGTAPLVFNQSDLRWIGENPSAPAVIFGQQLAQDSFRDRVEVALGALISALAGQAANLNDESGGGTDAVAKQIDTLKLIKSLRKFGAYSGDLGTIIMHSDAYFTLVERKYIDEKELYTGEGYFIAAYRNLRIVVVDTEVLKYVVSNKTRYNTLFLVDGAAASYDDAGSHRQLMDEIGGQTHIKDLYQSEWQVCIGLKGFSWKNTVPDPTHAQLNTTANWQKVATHHTDLPGVLLRHQVS